MKRAAFFALLCLAGIQLSCTVGYSFTGADIPAAAKSFSVSTFQVVTPQAPANYNILITESFKDLMLSQTRLNFATNSGDIQYEGIVTRYEVTPAAVSGAETASLNRLTITLKVRYTNTLEKEKNFEKTFSRFADFPATTDFFTVQESLITEINNQLTQDIFDASLGAW